MKVQSSRITLVLLMMCIITFATSLFSNASSLDDLSSSQNSDTGSYETGSSDDSEAILDYLHGYTPVTGENMKSAGTVANPIVNFLGTVAGAIIMVVSAAIFVVTALDLAYIGLPFCRSWLNPELAGGGAQAGGGGMGGMGMGGMGMGMGRGMGMGMGMGAGGAQAGGVPESGLRRKWVSDEAVYCVNTYANQSQPQGGGGAMGGMGMGGMGMGMGMGGMGGMGGGAQQQQVPMKSVIYEYLKKRTFFIIVFSVCSVVLMSSVFMDCGLNIAALIIKVVTKINGAIGSVNV